MNQVDQTPSISFHSSVPRQIANYLWRATWLRCPVCGTRPVFLPLRRTRRMADWFTPLDWCPNCRYLYEREPGYFLISQWAIGYGTGAVVGFLVYFYLQAFHSDWSLARTLFVAALPVPLINILSARHAKAYFIAADHLIDPHMMGGHVNTYECIKAFSETDFTEDLKRFDVPTLIIHGDDDQIVPIGAAGLASTKLVPGAKLIVYAGAPHALPSTHIERLNTDLLEFIRD